MAISGMSSLWRPYKKLLGVRRNGGFQPDHSFTIAEGTAKTRHFNHGLVNPPCLWQPHRKFHKYNIRVPMACQDPASRKLTVASGPPGRSRREGRRLLRDERGGCGNVRCES
jgi:hypothetical protein